MGTRVVGRNGDQTSFNDLPPEMAVYIFTKLPVKYLIRSTSVSKTWYSLIVNPNFISSQITHSLSSSDQNAVLIIPTHTSRLNYCILVSAETGHVCKYEIPFTTKTGTFKLVGSINGLVCVTELGRPKTPYLWNPCLRKYKCIESSCFSDDLFRDLGDHSYVIGLGFHERTSDYRVVRILSCVDKKNDLVENVVPKVEVFSLRTNEWREIENSIGNRLGSFEFNITVNGFMYGLSEILPETYSEEVWILSFDFNNEVFGQHKLPDAVRYCLGESPYFTLMKFEGSLCVCVFDEYDENIKTQPFCIWLMRKEDGIISWTKRFNVALKEHGFPYQLTKNGALIMLSYPRNIPVEIIIFCDLKSLQYKYLQFGKLLDHQWKLPATVDTTYVESLVMHAGGDRLLKSP